MFRDTPVSYILLRNRRKTGPASNSWVTRRPKIGFGTFRTEPIGNWQFSGGHYGRWKDDRWKGCSLLTRCLRRESPVEEVLVVLRSTVPLPPTPFHKSVVSGLYGGGWLVPLYETVSFTFLNKVLSPSFTHTQIVTRRHTCSLHLPFDVSRP